MSPRIPSPLGTLAGCQEGLGRDRDNEGVRSGNGGIEGDDSLCTK